MLIDFWIRLRLASRRRKNDINESDKDVIHKNYFDFVFDEYLLVSFFA
jgi:hypothetical protein